MRSSPWADRGVRPYDFLEKASVKLVGDDAHIVPAERADITEICGEFDGTLGSMCSIDPYEVREADVRNRPYAVRRRKSMNINRLFCLCF